VTTAQQNNNMTASAGKVAMSNSKTAFEDSAHVRIDSIDAPFSTFTIITITKGIIGMTIDAKTLNAHVPIPVSGPHGGLSGPTGRSGGESLSGSASVPGNIGVDSAPE
jgi:hypothetical protein